MQMGSRGNGNGEFDSRGGVLIKVKIAITEPDGKIPKYQTSGAAGMDLHASESVVIGPGQVQIVSTGIGIELPQGWEGQVRSRSGLATKNRVFVLNSPGTVDSDFRGTLKVTLANLGSESFSVKVGDRIAQLVFAQVPQVVLESVDQLSPTERGSGGWGSTGV